MNNPDWTEKYRPHKISDCILPDNIKKQFQSFVDAKFIPNMTLSGPKGIGKTSVARAMLDELGFDYLFLNTSLFGGIDTLRDKVMQFVSSMSLGSDRKYVVLDEADGMSNAFQDGLRGFIEAFSSNAGFILTCNNPSKIIDPLLSRCPITEIVVTKKDFQPLVTALYGRLCHILTDEKIEYKKSVIVEVINKTYPDFRAAIHKIQHYSITQGSVGSGILASIRNEQMTQIIDIMKSKDWNKMRDWVGENFSYLGSFTDFTTEFYKAVKPIVSEANLPVIVELINEHDYRNTFVIDKEINLVSFLTKLISELSWK